jgi:hypothetical protein
VNARGKDDGRETTGSRLRGGRKRTSGIAATSAAHGEEDHDLDGSDQTEIDIGPAACCRHRVASHFEASVCLCCCPNQQQVATGESNAGDAESATTAGSQRPRRRLRRSLGGSHADSTAHPVDCGPQPRRQTTRADSAATLHSDALPAARATRRRGASRQPGKLHAQADGRCVANSETSLDRSSAVAGPPRDTAREIATNEPSWLSVFHQLLFGEDYPQFRDRMIRRAAALASATPS